MMKIDFMTSSFYMGTSFLQEFMRLASNNSLYNYILRYVMYTFNLAISFDTIRRAFNVFLRIYTYIYDIHTSFMCLVAISEAHS